MGKNHDPGRFLLFTPHTWESHITLSFHFKELVRNYTYSLEGTSGASEIEDKCIDGTDGREIGAAGHSLQIPNDHIVPSKIRKSDKKYRWATCDTDFGSSSSSSSSSNDRFHRCITCNIYLNEHDLAAHISKQSLEIWRCHICNTNLSTQTWIRKHAQKHTREAVEGNRSLGYCPQMYLKQGSDAIPRHRCNVCGKEFASLKGLGIHNRKAHSTEKKHGCDYCGKKLKTKYDLIKHIRRHTLHSSGFKCVDCIKVFADTPSLRNHVESAHQDSVCLICGKVFGERYHLVYHVEHAHGS